MSSHCFKCVPLQVNKEDRIEKTRKKVFFFRFAISKREQNVGKIHLGEIADQSKIYTIMYKKSGTFLKF